MDFLDRARHALDRNDPARALVLLVQGLRREPAREDALDLFLHIYTRRIKIPGLESDLFRAVEYQGHRARLLRFVLEELTRLEKESMARAVEEGARERGWLIAESIWSESLEEDAGVQKAIGVAESDEHVVEAGRSARAPRESNTVESLAAKRGEPSRNVQGEREMGPTVSVGRRREPGRAVGRRRVLGLVMGLTILVILVVAGVVGHHYARERNRVIEIERAMHSLDPLAPEEARRTLDRLRLSPSGSAEQSVREMRDFINGLLAMEGHEGIWKIAEDEPVTSWGLGAAALVAAEHESWEEAMRFVHLLDRRHGESLAALFVHGRVCEAREDWECALARYDRTNERFGQFLPAYTGAMRVAAARFDRLRFEEVRTRLREVSPEHLYASLVWVEPVWEIGLGAPTEQPFPEITGEEEHFLKLWKIQREVVRAVAALDFEAAVAGCERGTEEVPRSLPTFELICASVLGFAWQPNEVRGFLRGAAREGRTIQLYRQVQTQGARLLTDLGRADWAVAFVIPFEGLSPSVHEDAPHAELVRNRGLSRPEAYQMPEELGDEATMEALMVRAEVFRALGATTHARETARLLVDDPVWGDEAKALIARAYLVDGDRTAAHRQIEQVGDEELQRALRGVIAHLEGDHEAAVRHFEDVQRVDDWIVRARVQSYIAVGRGRDARTLLDSNSIVNRVGLRLFRQSVLARLGEGEAGQWSGPLEPETLQSLDHLIDLGAVRFWERNLGESRALLDKAEEIAPEHPEVHWRKGLIARVMGDMPAARRHFRRAWRGDEDSVPMLIEIGRVQLELGRYDLAREVFLLAALRDRRSLEAIEGLGLAYLYGDRARGERDLREVLRLVPQTERNAVARAEFYRWIAVVRGSREGKEEALQDLKSAQNLAGDRVGLLVEEARYLQARGEFESARHLYARALQRNPLEPEIHLGLAAVTVALDDREAAREHLERLMALTPSDEERAQADLLREILNGEL